MSKILIEEYRSWDIYFDTEYENFYTNSDQWDAEKTKTSYSSIKTFIDNHIKDNAKFKPIFVVKVPNIYGGSDGDIELRKLIGIRKDLAFTYENKNNKPTQFANYEEKNFVIYNPETQDPLFKQLKEISDKIKLLQKESVLISKKFEGESLQTIRELYK